MVDIKLTYFNGRGLAEVSRLILAYAGQHYDDIRIEKEAWPDLKESTPFGKLPILEYDGKVFPESFAIARFLANEFGLAGCDKIERLVADGLVESCRDFYMYMGKIHYETDEARKKELREKFLVDGASYIKRIDKKLISHGENYFAGKNLTWADFALLHIFSTATEFFPEVKELIINSNRIDEVLQRIFALPKIKEWIEKRPKTTF